MATVAGSRETDPFQVRALARGLSILGLFDVDNREWTIDEMAEQTGLVRMTVYRMVRTLESMAFLVRDPATNRYRLGPSTLAMTYVSDDHSEFVQAARPFLEKLVKDTGESVTLAIEVDGFPVCVDIINTTRPFKRRTAPGRILGDLASVHGKIFTAFRPPEQRQAVLEHPVPRWTPHTVTDRDTLAAELDRIVEDDVAFDLEGLYPGICAVAAPVRDQSGAVIATISVVVPSGRFGPDESALCMESVKVAAASFSAYLGWNSGLPTHAANYSPAGSSHSRRRSSAEEPRPAP
jgi:DNA-binding IclR family transcriptional regulator